ncbi:MAG TPA: metal-dependent hydrolase [Blastocatellia bacterium]|nr:metal-dependent hydrolase [Blastocatellia bacterium]HMV83638.1 metal-dependent hydrolase [Blastocatellia bacterium]HMX28125.1 metal-dependent hydrolase [Blastocatellia bacterium]HMY74150.1 metal-dependent hydrolase [Blastocatellia bacterium]HMZ20782.1 metal-dependent hydrolase [Blastocatellia bacterium]
MPLPIAHGLIGASLVIAAREEFSWRENWWPLLVGAVLAVTPDFDLFFAWTFGFSDRLHGGVSHSILFAIPLGLLGAPAAREFTRRGILTYFAIALSHGLLDFVTKKEFGGAALLWPFSSQKLRLGIFSYYEFTPAFKQQPLTEILEGALNVCYYEVLTFVPLFVAVLIWKNWRQRRAW